MGRCAALNLGLINEGHALGCLVNVLPVKDDPITSRILWSPSTGSCVAARARSPCTLQGASKVARTLRKERIKRSGMGILSIDGQCRCPIVRRRGRAECMKRAVASISQSSCPAPPISQGVSRPERSPGRPKRLQL